MKLTFLGATHEVTGSCYLLEACQKRVLIDYGMEQVSQKELPFAKETVKGSQFQQPLFEAVRHRYGAADACAYGSFRQAAALI